jgi:hypothetical protein
MGGKNSAPPPPNYGPLIEISKLQSDRAYKLGTDQLAWAKEAYAGNKVINDQIAAESIRTQKQSNDFAKQQQDRYTNTIIPVQDSLIKDAKEYASPERQQYEMGRAQAGVSENFENSRRAAAQHLEGFGVDPTSTRYAALDMGSRIQEAAAKAAAGNQARINTENTGFALRGQAIGMGGAIPGQVASSYGTGLQAGNQGANVGLATTASGANTMGTGAQWTGIGNNALQGAAGMMNQGYNNQIAQYNANQQSSSGIGSLLGGVLGVASMFADGGSTDPAATPGGRVNPHQSPSSGKAIDDVDAKLTVGEFVVPKDTVAWLGEKHFQSLIEKSRKDRSEATAKPKYALAPAGAPSFTSRPQNSQRGALPMAA